MTFLHAAFGLVFELPFFCSALPLAPEGSLPDVEVVYGDVPRELPAPLVAEQNWQATENQFLYRAGPQVGRMLALDGCRIIVKRWPAATDDHLSFFLLDMVTAMLLQQRDLLVLHANSIVTPRGAVVVTGQSGAGKSTLLAEMLTRGHAMLADDITAVSRGDDGIMRVLPGIPQYHLCDDAADRFVTSTGSMQRFLWRSWKVAVPAAAHLAPNPAPLTAVYCLSADEREDLRIAPLYGREKFDTLRQHVFGLDLAKTRRQFFALLTDVCSQADIYRVERPRGSWTVDMLADVLESGSSAVDLLTGKSIP